MGFFGQVVLVGDSIGAILCYDALTQGLNEGHYSQQLSHVSDQITPKRPNSSEEGSINFEFSQQEIINAHHNVEPGEKNYKTIFDFIC